MGYEIELGGPATRSDVTITTQNSDIMTGQHPTLESKVGRGRARIAVQWLDINRKKRDRRFTLVGRVKEASLPDANGLQPNVGMYTLVVSCDEKAA
jgi:hypothetical protein